MKLDRVIAVRNQKTVFRDGDHCVKVFHSSYTKSAVLNEALNQTRIEETGLNIPEILEITTFNDKWAIVSRYIRGKTLAQLMDEQPESLHEHINLLADLHTQIHERSCPLLSRLQDRLNLNIERCVLDATTRFALHTRLEEMPRQKYICHGDFRPSNIIISEDGTPYMLDWSRATQGNPAADAVRTYLSFLMNGQNEAAEQYLAAYCEKSGRTPLNILGWGSIVAAAMSVDCNAEKRAFLISWIKQAEKERKS